VTSGFQYHHSHDGLITLTASSLHQNHIVFVVHQTSSDRPTTTGPQAEDRKPVKI